MQGSCRLGMGPRQLDLPPPATQQPQPQLNHKLCKNRLPTGSYTLLFQGRKPGRADSATDQQLPQTENYLAHHVTMRSTYTDFYLITQRRRQTDMSVAMKENFVSKLRLQALKTINFQVLLKVFLFLYIYQSQMQLCEHGILYQCRCVHTSYQWIH